MSTADPATFTIQQQRAAYDALGLDPDGFTETTLVVITPTEVMVTRRLRNDAGRLYVVDDQIASETTILELAE